jgi:putative aldouronate transport system permease protein
MPHFISLVIICALVMDFCSTRGLINTVILKLGGTPLNFMNDPKYFYPVYTISGIWQHMGWDSIIYLAALAGIDPTLYEAATVDGAGRFRRIWHITLPGIAATISILLILRIGSIMSVGYEKIILLYSPATYETADTISTYVYRRGLQDGKYSFAAAVGLMNSVVNFILLMISDRLSKKLGQLIHCPTMLPIGRKLLLLQQGPRKLHIQWWGIFQGQTFYPLPCQSRHTLSHRQPIAPYPVICSNLLEITNFHFALVQSRTKQSQ